MSNIFIKALTASSIGLFAIDSAFAGEFSVGLMAGQTSFDGIDNICNEVRNQGLPPQLPIGCRAPDENDSSIGINASYHFNNSWAIEGGYANLGEYVTTISASRISSDISLEAQALYLAVVSTLPISNKFSLSARAGGYEARGNVSSVETAFDSKVDGDLEFYSGVSLDFRALDNIVLQARYDSFDDISTLTAGVQFRF